MQLMRGECNSNFFRKTSEKVFVLSSVTVARHMDGSKKNKDRFSKLKVVLKCLNPAFLLIARKGQFLQFKEVVSQ